MEEDTGEGGDSLASNDVRDGRLLGARGQFLENESSRKLFWGYAKDANRSNTGNTRTEFSRKIRDLLGHQYLTKAEADYCAGWAALAAQVLEGTANEDDELVKLMEAAVPGGEGELGIVAG